MVEIKSYMWVGYSRKRFEEREYANTQRNIKNFSKKLADELGWIILDDSEPSRVALIAERDFPERIMKF